MTQEDKTFLNLAGEFAVASELNRRRVLASVTYGASKSADVFALSADMKRVVRVEVKTTDKEKWPVGAKATTTPPQSSSVFWVLVKLPRLEGVASENTPHDSRSPRYFVLSAWEIHRVWKKGADVYRGAYRSRHGRDFQGLGVPNVTMNDVLAFEGKWSKIIPHLNRRGA